MSKQMERQLRQVADTLRGGDAWPAWSELGETTEELVKLMQADPWSSGDLDRMACHVHKLWMLSRSDRCLLPSYRDLDELAWIVATFVRQANRKACLQHLATHQIQPPLTYDAKKYLRKATRIACKAPRRGPMRNRYARENGLSEGYEAQYALQRIPPNGQRKRFGYDTHSCSVRAHNIVGASNAERTKGQLNLFLGSMCWICEKPIRPLGNCDSNFQPLPPPPKTELHHTVQFDTVVAVAEDRYGRETFLDVIGLDWNRPQNLMPVHRECHRRADRKARDIAAGGIGQALRKRKRGSMFTTLAVVRRIVNQGAAPDPVAEAEHLDRLHTQPHQAVLLGIEFAPND